MHDPDDEALIQEIQPVLELDHHAVSSDGTQVASSNPVDRVQLYDAETLTPVSFDESTPSSVVRFSPDGSALAAAVNQWRPQPSWPRIVEQPVRYTTSRAASCPIVSSAGGRSATTSSTRWTSIGTDVASRPA